MQWEILTYRLDSVNRSVDILLTKFVSANDPVIIFKMNSLDLCLYSVINSKGRQDMQREQGDNDVHQKS